MTRRVLSALAAGCFATPLTAATVDLNIDLNFDAVLVEHRCREGVGGVPNPGDGNCGNYQDPDVGVVYASSLSLVGTFEESDGGYDLVSGKHVCGTVLWSCPKSSSLVAYVSSEELFLRPFSSDFNAYYEFDFLAGTGFHTWTDDDEPYYGEGLWEFTNVTVTGIPLRNEVPAVPLPATALALLTGLAMLMRRRSVRM